MKYIQLFIAVGIILFAILVIVKASIYASRKSKQDWATLRELEEKAHNVKTKEEIEKFHAEFREKANKIHNSLITPQLLAIDAYLRGLYQQYKN